MNEDGDDGYESRAHLSHGHMERRLATDGYRDGRAQGEEETLQAGFNAAHRCGVAAGAEMGRLLAIIMHADWLIDGDVQEPVRQRLQEMESELRTVMGQQKVALQTAHAALRRPAHSLQPPTRRLSTSPSPADLDGELVRTRQESHDRYLALRGQLAATLAEWGVPHDTLAQLLHRAPCISGQRYFI